MTAYKSPKDNYSKELSESIRSHKRPGVIIRGTLEWHERERARKANGCTVTSFGSIYESNKSRGESAKYSGY